VLRREGVARFRPGSFFLLGASFGWRGARWVPGPSVRFGLGPAIPYAPLRWQDDRASCCDSCQTMGNDEADDAPPEAKRARVEPDTTTMSEPSQGAVVAEVPATHSDAATHATAAGEVTQEERGGRGGRSGRGVQGGRRGRGGRSAYKGKKADRRGEDKPEDERVERGPRPQYAKRKVGSCRVLSPHGSRLRHA
jgi:hypothetical protein